VNGKIWHIPAVGDQVLLNLSCHPELGRRSLRMIDWMRVKELRDEVGAEDFDEVVDLFLEEVEEVTERMKTTFDLTTLEGDLHFLKGSALSIGFSEFASLCQGGETASGQGHAGDVDVGAILTSYDASKVIFLNELPGVLAT
jgi:HPt (histidine-containing phosphotransfer) domain-containing protein